MWILKRLALRNGLVWNGWGWLAKRNSFHVHVREAAEKPFGVVERSSARDILLDLNAHHIGVMCHQIRGWQLRKQKVVNPSVCSSDVEFVGNWNKHL